MNGILTKLNDDWVVDYTDSNNTLLSFPIHPEEPIFVDKRWLNTEIQFDIVMDNGEIYAKNIQAIETIQVIEAVEPNETWSSIRKKFDDSYVWRDNGVTFIDWLIKNYNPPNVK